MGIYQPSETEVARGLVLEARNKLASKLSFLRHPKLRILKKAILGKDADKRSPQLLHADECYLELKEFFWEGQKRKPVLPKNIQIETSKGRYVEYRRWQGAPLITKFLMFDRHTPTGEADTLRLLVPKENTLLGTIFVLAIPQLRAKDDQFADELKQVMLFQEDFFSEDEIDLLLHSNMAIDDDPKYKLRRLLGYFSRVANRNKNTEAVQRAEKAVREKFEELPENWAQPTEYSFYVTQYLEDQSLAQEELTRFSGGTSEINERNHDVMKQKDRYINVSPTSSLGLFHMHNDSAVANALGRYYLEALKHASLYVLVPGAGSGKRVRISSLPNKELAFDFNQV